MSACRKSSQGALPAAAPGHAGGHGHPGRDATYAKAVDAFRQGTAYSGDNVELVEIPYGDAKLSAYYVRAAGDGPKPVPAWPMA